MNYEKIYNDLILKAKSENRVKGEGVYYETHHITPRCVGGSDDSDNLVNLTAKEHFIAHKLLCEIYPGENKLVYAYWCMSNMISENRDYRIGSKEFERIRNNFVIRLSESMKGENNPMYGKSNYDIWLVKYGQEIAIKKWKEQQLKSANNRKDSLIGEKNPMYGMTGDKNPFYGKKHDETTKNMLSEKAKKRTGFNGQRTKPVLDITTGVFYTLSELSELFNISTNYIGRNIGKSKFKNYVRV